MQYLNEYEITAYEYEGSDDPVRAQAIRNLVAFVELVNDNSDGWPYWLSARRAADRTVGIVTGERPATEQELKTATATMRRFMTKHSLQAR